MPAAPVAAPDGTAGVETVSGIVTASPAETLDTMLVSAAQRACTVTENVPGPAHVWLALVVPLASQPEFVLSPQSNRY